ncbi:abortive infection family protein [Photobacterium damselae]|uniref:abortive infection family protein n=1 Tax=Photobacterium damselae TaxID=38293 RepID=UPI001245BA53|nr:abortive infection family protein [Photobacterium damselae]KAB1181770.1 abortive infection family protein [Photobacterium damselae subsp. damselae]MBF7100486.1 abortive infection family protein [Photobacterium damselae]
MSQLLEKIKGQSSRLKEKRAEVLIKLEKLEDALTESLEGIDIWARSVQETLQMIGPDDWIYGYLQFSDGKLMVAYRSTEDDFADSMNQLPDDYQSFQYKSIKSCSIEWIERLSKDYQINMLLVNIERKLISIENNTSESINSLNKALDSQSEAIASETINALKDTNSDELIRDWIKARNTIQSDPSDSITRSSSYLESVCRFILTETGKPLPAKKDITSLIGTAIKALDLSTDQEANRDMIQLYGGIKSIFQAVGAMRTHFGTAHGFTPGDYVASEHYARLVNDASATASTYLLRRLKQKM